MSRFLLIRHANHDYVDRQLVSWTPGVHINAGGRVEAERLAEALAGVPIDALYSSPLERTLDTAEPISNRKGLRIHRREALGEVRFGDWTGRRIPELNDDPAWRAFNRFRSLVRAPGGEHMLEVQTRMITELERIRAAHPHGIVAVISHGDALRAAILHYLGMPLDFIHRIEISPASVTAVDVSDGAPRLRCLNWRAPDDGGKFCL